MSEHHRAQKWTSFTSWRRPELARQLPLPCIRCGRAVHPDPPGMIGTRWHVGHITDAAKGGRPTRENTGAIHARCNLIDGGRAGAAITNRARRRERGTRAW